jgi:signal transduction histidine kinase
MFRFTIRDVLWLTVVVGLAVAWAIEHQQLTVARSTLQLEQAEKRMADLRERELRGGVILTPAPARIRVLDRGGIERSRAKDE